jgi:hypothetical protein
MRFQPPAGLPILAPSTYLAALVCSVGDHPAQTFPVTLIDTRPHVGEPAATRYEVNEQAGTEVAVFAGKQIGYVWSCLPAMSFLCSARKNSANSLSGSLSEPADTGCASAPADTVVTSPPCPAAATRTRKTVLPTASATAQAPWRMPRGQVPAVPRCGTAIHPDPQSKAVPACEPASGRRAPMINLSAHAANPRHGNRRHHGFLPCLGNSSASSRRLFLRAVSRPERDLLR